MSQSTRSAIGAGRASARRRRLLTATILAALSLASIAPVSPAAADDGASTLGAGINDFICYNGPAYGGRSSNTVAWGQGQMACYGDVGSENITLQLQLCLSLGSGCLGWQNVNPIMAFGAHYGQGSFWVPTSGVARQGGLSDGARYRLVQTGRAQSTRTGIWYEDKWITASWIQ
jgi:hypothetical protein